MKLIACKKWEKGKWIPYDGQDEKLLDKYYSVLKELLADKKIMVLSYSDAGDIVSKAVYVNLHENDRDIWINSDATADLSKHLVVPSMVTGYIFDEASVSGVMLKGTAEIEKRHEYILRSWRDEFIDWYDDGVFGKDFTVIHFHIETVRVFYDSKEITIALDTE